MFSQPAPLTAVAVTALLEDTARFVRWILSHKYADVVGYAGSDCECPVALYLRDATGHPLWVSPEHVALNSADTITVQVPVKIGEFIIAIDGYGRYEGPVTRRRAMTLIRRLGWEIPT